MRIDRKTAAAAIGVAGLLGVGLYVAVPAAATPSPSPSPSSSTPPKKPGARNDHGGKHRFGPHGFRARHGVRGVHGTATVKQKDGKFVQVTWQIGQVTARSGDTLTVRSADGATWAWTTNADTKIRKRGDKKDENDKGAQAQVANGDQVMVWGRQDGTTRTAKLVRVRA